MKALALCLLLMAPCVQAETIPQLTTLRGRTYRGCEIVKVHPDGVSFTHANGAAKILFTDLSSEWRTRLGYDAAKAAAYRQQLEEQRQREAAARAQREAELNRALAVAEQMSRLRQLGQAAQAAASRPVATTPTFAPSAVPVLPTLGAVFISQFDRPSFRRFSDHGLIHGFGAGFYPGYGNGFSMWQPPHPCQPPRAPMCPPRIIRVTNRE